MAKSRWQFGPGFLVAAAFIGPGTVLTASKAGAEFQYALVWALLFSVIATIVLQEMSARLAIVSHAGLAEAISNSIPNKVFRWLSLGLVLVAILFGNCAYQSGNLAGAGSGLTVLGWLSSSTWISVIASLVLVLIWVGKFKLIQNLMTGLVVVMSALFMIAAIVSRPDWGQVAAGMVPRSLSNDAWLKVIGLIGTTVVPYNLFLHASAALEHWPGNHDPGERSRNMRSALIDTIVSVSVGGLITLAIMITAAQAFAGSASKIETTADIANQLKPALGNFAQSAFALGLFSAGLTSAITAPIAAAYTAAGCFGIPAKLSDIRLKYVASAVVLIGLIVNLSIGKSPSEVILTAQIANGFLLPLIVLFLIFVVNNRSIMGANRNRWFSNLLGAFVLIVILAITIKQSHAIYDSLKSLFAKSPAAYHMESENRPALEVGS